MILPRSFYLRTDILRVARDLLGKVLVSDLGDQRTEGRIVEVEAYRGPDDKGSHAYLNNDTKRTRTMFLEGGRTYVYLCYGIHHMFNVVTGPEDVPHAILIRAIEPLTGINWMLARRGFSEVKRDLTNGPGKFTIAMNIKKDHNGLSLWSQDGPLFIRDPGMHITENEIVTSPRVGIAYAQECAHWPWRFRIRGNEWTSKPEIVTY